MKILFYSDVHWAAKMSIITKLGSKYTKRLEMLIDSLNWMLDTAKKYNCVATICAGDFFDKPNLTAEEITALNEINRDNYNFLNYILVGNHDSDCLDLSYNASNVLKSKNRVIVDTPKNITIGNSQIHFIPYITDYSNIDNYILDKDDTKAQILVMHNDLAGINYGPIVSKVGLDINYLSKKFDLILNGHIHNSEWITNNILNLGSISAHNFTNDSFKYKYGAWLFNTDTLELTFIENPYAFNFYKLEINSEHELNKLNTLKNNAVVSVQCPINIYQKVVDSINNCSNIVESRIIIKQEYKNIEQADITDLSIDHFAKFAECCKAKLENTKILEEELTEILR